MHKAFCLASTFLREVYVKAMDFHRSFNSRVTPLLPFSSLFLSDDSLHYKGEIIGLLTFCSLVTAKLAIACE